MAEEFHVDKSFASSKQLNQAHSDKSEFTLDPKPGFYSVLTYFFFKEKPSLTDFSKFSCGVKP